MTDLQGLCCGNQNRVIVRKVAIPSVLYGYKIASHSTHLMTPDMRERYSEIRMIQGKTREKRNGVGPCEQTGSFLNCTRTSLLSIAKEEEREQELVKKIIVTFQK